MLVFRAERIFKAFWLIYRNQKAWEVCLGSFEDLMIFSWFELFLEELRISSEKWTLLRIQIDKSDLIRFSNPGQDSYMWFRPLIKEQ